MLIENIIKQLISSSVRHQNLSVNPKTIQSEFKSQNLHQFSLWRMLRYKHLKPWLIIQLVSTLLLTLTAIGITVTIILNEINGFNFSPVQFLSCPLYTNNKVNNYLEIILQVCFIMSITAIVFALGQFATIMWQFINLRKQTQEKGDNEENQFEYLSFGKLIFMYLLNGLGFMCLVPIFGSFWALNLQFLSCSDPLQNSSSLYTLPTAIAGVTLFLQICSLCMSLKLVYHFEHKDSDSQNDENYKGNHQQNKYRHDNNNDRTNPRWAERNKELQEMERMRQRIREARKQMANNNSGYNENGFLSRSTQQGSPRPLESGLLSNYPRNSTSNPDSSIYDNPVIIGSSKSRLPKQKRNKYGANKSNKVPNKYSYNPSTDEKQSSNPNPSDQINSKNQTKLKNNDKNLIKSTTTASNQLNHINPNNQTNKYSPISQNNAQNGAKASSKNDVKNSGNTTNPQNFISPNLSSKNPQNSQKNSTNSPKNPTNSTQNPTNQAQKPKKIPIKQSQGKTQYVNKNGDRNKQMSAEQISQKQKELMKKLPKNPYKKNISSKHQPSSVIFEQPDSEEEGSEFVNKPLLTSSINQLSNSKPQGQNKSQSPIHEPQYQPFDFQDDQISLNQTSKINQPIRVKYLNSPYLKNLQDKNISPEKRRNIKRPFLKIAGNVLEFDSKNYQVTATNFNNNNAKIYNRQRQNSTLNDPLNQEIQTNNQDTNSLHFIMSSYNNPTNKSENQKNSINHQQNHQNHLQPSNSKKKLSNPHFSMSAIFQGILEAQTLQNENPILQYIQQDEQYQDQIQKILDYEKFSKKKRRYIYNPFEAQNQNNEQLYLHKSITGRALMLTQNMEGADYDPFQDEEFDNVNCGKMTIQDDGNGNPVLKICGNSKHNENSQSQAKKNKKDAVLLDFIRSKHVID